MKNNTVKGEAMPEVKAVETKQAENAVKTPTTADIQKLLKEQIEKANRLNKLVNERGLFVAKKEQLTNFLEAMRTEVKGENLETKFCKMVLIEPNSYNKEGITISNSLVVEKALRFIATEIEEKVKLIETEILTIN